jgi:thiol-disulfide isomerase/thioredoxin
MKISLIGCDKVSKKIVKKKSKTNKKNSFSKPKSKKKVKKITLKNKIIRIYKRLKKEATRIYKNIKKRINKYKKHILSKKLYNKEESARKEEELKGKEKLLNNEIILEPKTEINLKLVFSVMLVIFIMAIVVLLLNRKEDTNITFSNINMREYKELYKNEELQYIYITKNNCTYCELINPYVFDLEKDYDIEFKTLNISGLNANEISDLKKSNTAFEDDWEAPILITIKNGKEISSVKGYKEYQVLKKFVEYSINPTDNNSFIKIDVSRFIGVLNSSELSLVYIGRPNSKSCKMYLPILESVTTEENIKVYYLNTDTIDTEKEWSMLSNSNDIFKKNWFVPATLIVKDNKVISYKMETMDKDDLLKFLDKNGL